ncbi:dihydrolipoyl dehydrogenase family protein [Vreelandella boliviensis]|mgnify:CR=1 FL=1|uniref:dihydrolipoyl dehydrogenase family protein n=1 Tax=Vreelandella boliviensis TaxID=223527 RepID=UPI001B8BC72A|nr:FAD-dependent oxidoreductase [Halomonas boliviensis]MBS3669990.1 FAD-dependent oxidoreductase [Halomonas boliviensis]
MKKFDLAVIGAGAGGLNSALTAASSGLTVVLIERNKPGGECTWSGCIPSKALIQIAKDVKTAQKFSDFEIDTGKIMQDVKALVHKAHQAESVDVLTAAGVTYLHGSASFTSTKTLEVNGVEVHANNVIVATGSSPVVPTIQGLETIDYLTNEGIFELTELPKSLIILGAGAIGVELSQAMQRLGVQVSLVDMAPTILPREEPDLARLVSQTLIDEGVEVYTGCRAKSVAYIDSGVQLTVDQGTADVQISGEKILLALGRKPNTQGIKLEEVGVDVNYKGIIVDEFCETSIKHVFAVGDVASPFLFSHTAGHQARSVIRNLVGSERLPVELDSYAWCTFFEPELARCGLTEAEARLAHGDTVRVYSASYDDLDRAVVDQKTTGMAKVICDKTGKILGASILGERACELLCELQVLKQHDIPLQELQNTIHPYPGYSELLLGLSLDAYSDFNS